MPSTNNVNITNKKVTNTNNVNKKVSDTNNANKKQANSNNVSNDTNEIFDDILLDIENAIKSL